jgi:hypothetical protein
VVTATRFGSRAGADRRVRFILLMCLDLVLVLMWSFFFHSGSDVNA